MLIEGFFYIIYEMFDLLLAFNVPQIPQTVHEYISYALEFITSGASILANYTPLTYMISLFAIIVTVDIGIMVYELVMWVIRKIPMAGMS